MGSLTSYNTHLQIALGVPPTASEFTGSFLKTKILKSPSRPAESEPPRVGVGDRHGHAHKLTPSHTHFLQVPQGTQVSRGHGKLRGNRPGAHGWQENQVQTSPCLYCRGLCKTTFLPGSPPDRGLGSHRPGHRDSTGAPTVPRTHRAPSISRLPWAGWDQVMLGGWGGGESAEGGARVLCPVFSSARDPFQSYHNLRGYFLRTGPWRRSENRGGLRREWRRNSVLWIQYQLCDFPPPRDKYCALQLI